jgi:imidazoleglycerol-phosphate dehydratase
MKRTARLRRTTKETDITVDLNLDGDGTHQVRTKLPFLDHMLGLLSKHSLVNLTLRARGDLEVDYHHTVEDIGLTLGTALDKALGDRKGIARFGEATVPMDESLSRVVVDFGGRPFLVLDLACKKKQVRDFDLGLVGELLRGLTVEARMNLHVTQFYGQEAHHAYESVFKALGLALRRACAADPRVQGVPSTKGMI